MKLTEEEITFRKKVVRYSKVAGIKEAAEKFNVKLSALYDWRRKVDEYGEDTAFVGSGNKRNPYFLPSRLAVEILNENEGLLHKNEMLTYKNNDLLNKNNELKNENNELTNKNKEYEIMFEKISKELRGAYFFEKSESLIPTLVL